MYQKILVPIDGSPTANEGLAEAVKLGKLTGARLRLLHAVDMLSITLTPEASMSLSQPLIDTLKRAGQDILDKAKASVMAAGLEADTVLVDTLSGRISDLVVEEARKWGAELIVIGTHGRRGVGRLVLGSDAEQVLRLAPVPVLLVRARHAAKLLS
ncbi:MAG TPA: universal stress protein [Albitalea sp.]|nr:universal stress protein [Albitalea sp.]